MIHSKIVFINQPGNRLEGKALFLEPFDDIRQSLRCIGRGIVEQDDAAILRVVNNTADNVTGRRILPVQAVNIRNINKDIKSPRGLWPQGFSAWLNPTGNQNGPGC